MPKDPSCITLSTNVLYLGLNLQLRRITEFNIENIHKNFWIFSTARIRHRCRPIKFAWFMSRICVVHRQEDPNSPDHNTIKWWNTRKEKLLTIKKVNVPSWRIEEWLLLLWKSEAKGVLNCQFEDLCLKNVAISYLMSNIRTLSSCFPGELNRAFECAEEIVLNHLTILRH